MPVPDLREYYNRGNAILKNIGRREIPFRFDDAPYKDGGLPLEMRRTESGELEVAARFAHDVFVSTHKANMFDPPITHRHDFFEFIYAHAGECVTVVNGEAVRLSDGDLCLMNTRASHSLRLVDPEACMVFNILIKEEAFNVAHSRLVAESSPLSWFFLDSMRDRRERDSCVTFRASELSGPAETILALLIRESFDGTQFKHVMLSQLLCSLMVELSRAYLARATGMEPAAPDSRGIEAIVRHIVDNCETVTLHTLSEHFHYTKTYMSGLISRHSGRTFSQIVQAIRFKKAAELLRVTERSVEDVAQIAGFANRSWFTRKFKEIYGVSPAAYRKGSETNG